MSLSFAAALLLASIAGDAGRAPTLVRFKCDDRPIARRADRVWDQDEIAAGLPHGWRVEVRDVCHDAVEFERIVGEGGALAACVLDSDGRTIGVLRGPAGVERCLEFLAGCSAAIEPGGDELDHIDSAIAWGAAHAVREELDCLREPGESDRCDPGLAALWERRARIEVLAGDIACAESSLRHARAAGIELHPVGSARARITSSLVDCAARRMATVRETLHFVLEQVEGTRGELDALCSIAESLHVSGADDHALDVCAAIESKTSSNALLASIETLRGHIANGARSHVH